MELCYNSDYAEVFWDAQNYMVFHVWKKACAFEEYRMPVKQSLYFLRKNPGSTFVVDARNGFEDDPKDVEWGFSYFLPEMKKSGCKKWIFIKEDDGGIDDELDVWSMEIRKYFEVYCVNSLEKALRMI